MLYLNGSQTSTTNPSNKVLSLVTQNNPTFSVTNLGGTNVTGENKLIVSFEIPLSNLNYPIFIPEQTWNLHIFAKSELPSGNQTNILFQVYTYKGNTGTLISKNSTTVPINGVKEYICNSDVPYISLSDIDSIVVKIYAYPTGDNYTITFYYQSPDKYSYIYTSFISTVNSAISAIPYPNSIINMGSGSSGNLTFKIKNLNSYYYGIPTNATLPNNVTYLVELPDVTDVKNIQIGSWVSISNAQTDTKKSESDYYILVVPNSNNKRIASFNGGGLLLFPQGRDDQYYSSVKLLCISNDPNGISPSGTQWLVIS